MSSKGVVRNGDGQLSNGKPDQHVRRIHSHRLQQHIAGAASV